DVMWCFSANGTVYPDGSGPSIILIPRCIPLFYVDKICLVNSCFVRSAKRQCLTRGGVLERTYTSGRFPITNGVSEQLHFILTVRLARICNRHRERQRR